MDFSIHQVRTKYFSFLLVDPDRTVLDFCPYCLGLLWEEQPPCCHKRGDRNKIFQLNRTGGHVFPVWGCFCLQWGPMRHCLGLLLEAISWSGRNVPQQEPPCCQQRGDRNKVFQLNRTGGHIFPVWGCFLPAVGANAALPGATIGGHKLEWEKCSPQQEPPCCHQRGDRNKIFQLNRTRGHRSPFWVFFSLQWGPVWHRLVLLLEAISWSWRVVPHRKNLPFATR